MFCSSLRKLWHALVLPAVGLCQVSEQDSSARYSINPYAKPGLLGNSLQFEDWRQVEYSAGPQSTLAQFLCCARQHANMHNYF